jgi:hypothetical protein
MDDVLFRTLLLESEGTRLDFKAQQYRFVTATDAEKSELLKDILAFANAWRTGPAFILIGVGAGKAGERALLGIAPTDHIDDAAIQQFVNEKLNRHLVFSYQPFTFDGKTYGVIEIPVQVRPFFADRQYGRVQGNSVYYRRGSSTAVASPDEVAQMGRDDRQFGERAQPNLTVDFADLSKRGLLGTTIGLEVQRHAAHDRRNLPDHVEDSSGDLPSYLTPLRSRARREFWRELADYVRKRRRFGSFELAIRNQGEQAAEDVRVVLTVGATGVELCDESDLPDYPRSDDDFIGGFRFPGIAPLLNERRGLPSIGRQASHWEVVIEPGRIRPQETFWVPEPIFVSSAASGNAELKVSVYAANLSDPIITSLMLQLTVENLEALGIDDLEKIDNEYRWERARRIGLLDDDEAEGGDA